MRLLFVTTYPRLWENLRPIMRYMESVGHEITSVGEIEGQLATITLARMLWQPSWSAVILCGEHLKPMNVVKGLASCSDGARPVIIAMQHAICQAPAPDVADLCDHYLLWGTLTMRLYQERGMPVPYTVVGNPRFDGYAPEVEDGGYLLAIPHKGAVTAPWLTSLHKAADGMPIKINVHPTDLNFEGQSDKHIEFIRGEGGQTRELIRRASAVYISYPSTCWIEAARYGKRIILGERAAAFFDGPVDAVLPTCVLPGDSCYRIARTIQTLAEGGSEIQDQTKELARMEGIG